MKVLLMSMPDVAPVIMHASAIHMPNLGIASVGGNIDPPHEVTLADLIRKRGRVGSYVARIIRRIRPELVGLSAMTWQFGTCLKLIRLIRSLAPETRIAVGGYHASLMWKEIAGSGDAGDIDFIVRGEGEETFRRLVNALASRDRMEDIPSLSYRSGKEFIHNPQGELLDLSAIRPPIRDHRRITWGYHVMNHPVEVMETSRGCTRSCHFCSIRRMYGKSFRAFPIERILADIDDIYHVRRRRWVFISDDNLVLDPDRVIRLCDAIIQRKYQGLMFVVQADCVSMARHGEMVRKMALAGMRSVFLGIENASPENLMTAGKGDITQAARAAVKNCHRCGIMVVGGLILGFPEDDEAAIIRNYEYFNSLEVDAAYCQLLTPYPKTGLRDDLAAQGLIVNHDDYSWYNGMWANVRTRHLSAELLQYLCWYHRQRVLGWWRPSPLAVRGGKLWTAVWRCAFKPILQFFVARSLRKYGWEGRYRREMTRLRRLNVFKDLDERLPRQ